MKTLKEIIEIMEALKETAKNFESEDADFITEMFLTICRHDKAYEEAYAKMHKIFQYPIAGITTVSVEPLKPIEPVKAEKAVTETETQTVEPAVEDTEEPAEEHTEETTTQEEEETDFCEVEVPAPSPEPETPIIFQHPDYPTIGAGADGQVYSLKDGVWKKADTRSVYFPRKKDGTWGRIERRDILDLLNNHNTSVCDEPQTEEPVKEVEYDKLPDGYFVHPTLRNLAANEDGIILKYNPASKKWAPAETIEDGRGCRKVKGERIGTGKCVYECINRFTTKSHVRHLNGDSWDDAFSNLTVYGDKNYHKFQQRTYGEADIHEICDYICKHNGDVSNISKDSKGKYSIYYARKILTKDIHDNISDKYFGYTSGGSIKIYKEAK